MDEPTTPAAEPLNKPLGHDRAPKKKFALPRFVPLAIAGALGAVILTFLGWALVVDDPLGGEPVAVVSTKPGPPKQDAAKPEPAGGSQDAKAGAPSGAQTVTIIDGMSGNRQQVTIAAAPSAPPATAAASTPTAASPPPAAQPAERATASPASPRLDEPLSESSRHGPIPRTAPDGARPSEVYAARGTAGRGAARIAIVVSRLGMSSSTATEALAKLPGPVTFAFTPYGSDLERWVARARGEGHEVLLQVPMEPFDYPDNDPGPRALMTSLTSDQNIDRLHWFMSRFQGYVGLTNHLGAKMLGNEPAMTAIMREAAKRGLIYVDDGAATRSLAGQAAGANGVTFARADIAIDQTPTAAEIDKALARLEQIARERGFAIGFANALPVSIDRIASWAKAAESRGVVLVPVTAVAAKARSS